MNLDEKVDILYDQYVKLVVEWGGTDYFTQCSDLDKDIAKKFFKRFFEASTVDEVLVSIHRAVNEQHERDEK